MTNDTTTTYPLTIGLDLGTNTTQCAIYGPNNKRIQEHKRATTRAKLTELFQKHPGARIVMEASTPTRWIYKLATELGHEVIIATPRNIPVITKSIRKSDVRDARLLAELGQVQPSLLSPITLRGDNFQSVRTILFAREQLVGTRTRLVTFVRSQVKAIGERLAPCSTKSFAHKVRESMPDSLKQPLESILQMIQMLSDRIDGYDADIDRLSKKDFPETSVLRQVHGVGPLVALAFVATIGDPKRFSKSRSVGAYMGLVPKLSQSGESNPGLSISKYGDSFMRSALVSSATRIMGPKGADSDLREYGLRIAGRGGIKSKAKARIAVARKLAVLLHALLATGEVYEPMRHTGEPATV